MPYISYAGCPGLSLVILVQFALKICVTARNCQKIHKNPYFSLQGHQRSLLLMPIKSQLASEASVRLSISD